MLRCKSIIAIFFCLSALAACNRQPNESAATDGSPAPASSSSFVYDDSAMYVGTVARLNANELYIDLFVKDSIVINDELHEYFQGSADSIIFQDDQIKRALLPGSIATEYFNLTNLEKLDLFDSLGQPAGAAEFLHVEFLEDFIETRIIAIYRSSGNSSRARYAIGGDVTNDRVDGFAYHIVNDKTLDKKVMSEIRELADAENDQFMSHRRFEPGGFVYTFASDHQTSWIFDHATSKVIYSGGNETFLEVIPVHKQRKGRPVLLVTLGEPETDIIWTMLMAFDGNEYQALPYQRLSKPDRQ